MQTLKVFKLDERAILPTRAYPTDAGLDLYSLEDVFLPEGSTKVIKTGIAIHTPIGHVLKIEDRSGLALKGLRTGAGVVDSDYSGEIGVVMHNLSNNSAAGAYDSYDRGYYIKKGDKIAQALLYKVETPEIEEIKELWNSNRGQNGWGSSDHDKKETTTGRAGNS